MYQYHNVKNTIFLTLTHVSFIIHYKDMKPMNHSDIKNKTKPCFKLCHMASVQELQVEIPAAAERRIRNTQINIHMFSVD